MPTKDTKIITLRVPNRVDFGDVNLHKLMTNIYDMWACNAVGIEDNKIVMPENNTEDPDGEWVREMAHVLNIDVKAFKRKIEQSVYR